MIEKLCCYKCRKEIRWCDANWRIIDGWKLAFCSACLRLTPLALDAAGSEQSEGQAIPAAQVKHDG